MPLGEFRAFLWEFGSRIHKSGSSRHISIVKDFNSWWSPATKCGHRKISRYRYQMFGKIHHSLGRWSEAKVDYPSPARNYLFRGPVTSKKKIFYLFHLVLRRNSALVEFMFRSCLNCIWVRGSFVCIWQWNFQPSHVSLCDWLRSKYTKLSLCSCNLMTSVKHWDIHILGLQWNSMLASFVFSLIIYHIDDTTPSRFM